MARKIPQGPSWFEVILGALLSFVLGVTLAAAILVLRPVTVVKELPKEADRVPGTIYYIEGSRDSGKVSRDSAAKRAQFAQGASVSVTEDEINLQIPLPAAPKPAPPPAQPKKPTGEVVPPLDAQANISPPNFRIRNSVVQIAVPVKLSAFGIENKIVVVAHGTFVRKDGAIVYQPSNLTVGSCILDRIPGVFGVVYEKFIGSQPIPPDIAASWAKLTGVHVDGDTLKLTMP